MTDKKICILGLGYVGLTLAVVLAEAGFKVVGIEKNQETVELLNRGAVHFHEKGLVEALRAALEKSFEVNSSLDCVSADVYIISVGTPVGEDRKPKLDDLINVSKDVARVLKKGDLVCLRSTVAPTTTREIVKPILENISGLTAGYDFFLSFAPERAAEGKALEELKSLPQVIGGLNQISASITADIFSAIASKIIMVNSLEEAEMIKAINNSYRDLVFAYANEVALICDKFNLDAQEVIKNGNSGYERSNIPMPSPGVGGYCLTKDPYILFDAAQKRGFSPKLIPSAREINEFMPKYVVGQIEKFCKAVNKTLFGLKIYIIGFAFKGWPETSDVRFSPTLDILSLLKGKNNNIYGFDPVVKPAVIASCGVKYAAYEEGFKNADCVLIMNNHPELGKINITGLLSTTNKPALFFDAWRMHHPDALLSVNHIKYSNLGYDTINEI